MDAASEPADPSVADDVDRRFRVLLEGLRTTLPGVQVLLAFLLTMPLQQSFGELASQERTVYLVTLIGAAVTIVLMTSPTIHQYLRAPDDHLKRRHDAHVIVGVRLVIAGSVTLTVTLLATVYLASVMALDTRWAGLAAAGVALLAVWAWYWLPLVRFRRDD
jgi:hypothetical protein